MLDNYLRERLATRFDFRTHACPDDPLRHLFEEWVDYYRGKFAICRALAPASILEIGVRYGYSAITFLEASPGASYMGLDNDSSSFGGKTGALDWAKRITASRDAQFLVVDTQQLEALPGERYDLVHVDGQQDGEGTYHDLELALEKARWILVDGIFWSSQNLEASTQFLQKYQSLVEFAVILPGYAGDLIIRVRDDAAFRRKGNVAHDHGAIRDKYARAHFSHHFAGCHVFDSGAGRELADTRLLALFDAGAPWQDQRVLDVGCGRGEFAFACHAAGATVMGLDYSQPAIDIACESYADSLGPELAFTCADVLAYDPPHPFDRIVAANFVEHLDPESLENALGRFAEWLAPGGRVLIHTRPNRLAYDYRHRVRRAKAAELGIFVPRNQRSLHEDRMHLNEQTPARLRRALRRHFTEAGVTTWPGGQTDPGFGLRSKPAKAALRSLDSIYAVASHQTIDVNRLRDLLTQTELDPAIAREVHLEVDDAPTDICRGADFRLAVRIRNGSAQRLASQAPFPVHLSYHWLRKGAAVVFDGVRTRLDRPVAPGEARAIPIRVIAPSDPGTYDLIVTAVQEGRFWLEDHSESAVASCRGIRVA